MQREIETIFVDADDTLWESGKYFELTRKSFVRLLQRVGIDPATTEFEITRRNRERTEKGLFGVEPFNEMLIEIFHEKVSCYDMSEMRDLLAILNSHRNHPVKLYPDVRETIRELSGRFHLILYTKGEKKHQSLKLDRSGIRSLFTSIHIVPVKNVEVLRSIIDTEGLSPERCGMVGDNYTDDIIPALDAGFSRIFWVTRDGRTSEAQKTPAPVTQIHSFLELFDHLDPGNKSSSAEGT